MHMVKLLAALGALSFSALVNAQAYLECGNAACGPSVQPWSTSLTTGINDLYVGGNLFDVSFTTTAPASSPFVLSSTTAAPGQPLTGIDAANAIGNFYGGLLPPYAGYDITGDQGPAFITAFAPAGALSSEYFGSTELLDAEQTIVGGGWGGSAAVVGSGFNSTAGGDGPFITADYGVFYTVWTPIAAPIAAPEISPASAPAGLTLLLGCLAVLRGRRPGQRVQA
jgi:hypothetical protein